MEHQTGLDNYLKMLSLHRIREIYLKEAENAANTKLSYQEYLHRLIEQQVLSKIERSVNAKMQRASFPQLKRLEEFDFTFQPKINEKLIRELATLDFLTQAKNVLLIGAPGVGKTHLAISLGIKATQARKRVLFFSAAFSAGRPKASHPIGCSTLYPRIHMCRASASPIA